MSVLSRRAVVKRRGFVATGGLGDYGSDESEEEEEERSAGGSESSDTDEEELRHRIRQKQDAFRRQERELQLQQERYMQEGPRVHGEGGVALPVFYRGREGPWCELEPCLFVVGGLGGAWHLLLSHSVVF